MYAAALPRVVTAAGHCAQTRNRGTLAKLHAGLKNHPAVTVSPPCRKTSCLLPAGKD
jgi:hypothetical protein